MKFLIAMLLGVVILLPSVAVAGTDCTTRRSGSVTITSCSDNNNPKLQHAVPLE